jgi:hypothetical protein
MAGITTSVEGENFNHRLLWFVVRRQLEHGETKPAGASHDHLVAMVFALHSMEAYLNFIGDRLAPDVWAREREYFAKDPYRGFAGKVRKVLELVNLAEPPKDQRPYSTIWLLKNLRDQIAHPKTEHYSFTTAQSPDSDVRAFYVPPFQGLVTPENAAMAYEDVEKFANTIHELAKPLLPGVIVGSEAFRGPLSMGVGSSNVAA